MKPKQRFKVGSRILFRAGPLREGWGAFDIRGLDGKVLVVEASTRDFQNSVTIYNPVEDASNWVVPAEMCHLFKSNKGF